jgi:ribosome-interacting GTPase 1
MPTNLPPEYFDAEKRYKGATSISEKIETLEELISTIPKHKGTDKLRAAFRKRLSKLKSSSQSQKSKSKRDSVFHIDKEGAGQVVVIGAPNVGKSSLVSSLTAAKPEIGLFPFTTQRPIPGMMPAKNVQIQLIDTPALSEEFLISELFDVIRNSELILLMVDLTADPFQQLEETMELLRRQRIFPRSQQGDRKPTRRTAFIPLIILVNKCDSEGSLEDFQVFCDLLEGEWEIIPISTETKRNLDQLKDVIFDRLDIIRVYSQAPGKSPDLDSPFVLKSGSTVEDFSRKVHLDFYENLKSARVWGQQVFDGQLVGRDHVLVDGDVVELRM